MEATLFQQPNPSRHPMEDYARIGATLRTFAVADGVTRLRYDPDDAFAPSGAFHAARIFCEEVVSYLDAHPACGRADASIAHAFDCANEAIRLLNERAGITAESDHDHADYFEAVGVAAVLCEHGHIHYGHVGDCRLVIYDAGMQIRVQTPDELGELKAYLLRSGQQDLLETRTLRATLRNRPMYRDRYGRSVSYGVFNGEPTVGHYMRFGSAPVTPGELVLLCSDGFTPLLAEMEVRQALDGFRSAGDGTRLDAALEAAIAPLVVRQPDKFDDDKTVIAIST